MSTELNDRNAALDDPYEKLVQLVRDGDMTVSEGVAEAVALFKGNPQLNRLLQILAERLDKVSQRLLETSESLERVMEAVGLAEPSWDTWGDWLLLPFKGPSCVFRITDTFGHMLRDEVAVIDVSRWLDRRRYAACRLIEAALGKPEESVNHATLASKAFARPGAVGFVGRLHMFGPFAEANFDNTRARKPRMLWFKSPLRPVDLPAGKLDPKDYHVLMERKEEGPAEEHKARDEAPDRIDHGLIQSYTVTYDGRVVRVVRIAGSSQLGTLGSAKLLELLFDKKNYPVPKNLKRDSQFEAFVRVRCPRKSLGQLDAVVIEEVKIWVDGRRVAGLGCDPVVTLLVDAAGDVAATRVNWGSTLKANSQNARMFCTLCREAAANGSVSIARLLELKNEWRKGGSKVTERLVRQLLVNSIKRTLFKPPLEDALEIDETGKNVRLHVKFVREPLEAGESGRDHTTPLQTTAGPAPRKGRAGKPAAPRGVKGSPT
ncbi:MAG: hypothetical protein HYS13_04490 [Planctomycetia bacterium]|nr:hypothetical protein [Planctomycetia bacterium]